MSWFYLLAALAAASPDPPASDFRLETDHPERGHYRLWASETIEVRAEALLAVLARSRCVVGCDAFAEHVAVDEVLERRESLL